VALIFVADATAEDLDALLAVERRSSPHPWTRRHFEAEMDAAFCTRTIVARRLVVETGELTIAGFCSYRRVAEEVHVENLAVDPDCRRQGLGSLLLRTALTAAVRGGARVAVLEVRTGNVSARGLYEALGFHQVGERRGYYSEPPEDAAILLRQL
jgi:ribosomal-protein-alanine N-acetyltransferase